MTKYFECTVTSPPLTLIRAASGQIDLWSFHSKITLDYFIEIGPFFMTFPKMWFYIISWKKIIQKLYFSPSNDDFKKYGCEKKSKFVTISVVIQEKGFIDHIDKS